MIPPKKRRGSDSDETGTSFSILKFLLAIATSRSVWKIALNLQPRKEVRLLSGPPSNDGIASRNPSRVLIRHATDVIKTCCNSVYHYGLNIHWVPGCRLAQKLWIFRHDQLSLLIPCRRSEQQKWVPISNNWTKTQRIWISKSYLHSHYIVWICIHVHAVRLNANFLKTPYIHAPSLTDRRSSFAQTYLEVAWDPRVPATMPKRHSVETWRKYTFCIGILSSISVMGSYFVVSGHLTAIINRLMLNCKNSS
jgi:hypothetical protein